MDEIEIIELVRQEVKTIIRESLEIEVTRNYEGGFDITVSLDDEPICSDYFRC